MTKNRKNQDGQGKLNQHNQNSGETFSANLRMDAYRDVMSAQRLRKLLHNEKNGIAKDVTILQKFNMSADLIPPSSGFIDPTAKPSSGDSSQFEVYRVLWSSRNVPQQEAAASTDRK
jgi:hypothetical protein